MNPFCNPSSTLIAFFNLFVGSPAESQMVHGDALAQTDQNINNENQTFVAAVLNGVVGRVCGVWTGWIWTFTWVDTSEIILSFY